MSSSASHAGRAAPVHRPARRATTRRECFGRPRMQGCLAPVPPPRWAARDTNSRCPARYETPAHALSLRASSSQPGVQPALQRQRVTSGYEPGCEKSAILACGWSTSCGADIERSAGSACKRLATTSHYGRLQRCAVLPPRVTSGGQSFAGWPGAGVERFRKRQRIRSRASGRRSIARDGGACRLVIVVAYVPGPPEHQQADHTGGGADVPGGGPAKPRADRHPSQPRAERIGDVER